MKVNTNPKKIKEVLTRGVEKIYPSRETLEKLLLSGKIIRLYCGYDPSAPNLHLGNAITLRKLSQFQKLGHKVIMLIGDFTGMIGDPTDKAAVRKKLSRKEVLVNAKNYKKQAGKFLNFSGENPAQLKYNSKWSDKLTFLDLIEITSCFTVQQMIARDMFQERIKRGRPIHLHEFFYPVAQGYDSVAMGVDLEVGGNDQTFNMLAGRDLIKTLKNKEKFVLTTKLLVDPTGKKMGKSEGNVVWLNERPEEIFGKIMSWSDKLITPAFELLTDVPMMEIKKISQQLKTSKVNPRDIKIKLAKEIVMLLNDKKSAQKAEEEFNRMFQQKQPPSQIKEISVPQKNLNILDLLTKTKLASSKSEAQRLILQKGVKIDGKIQNDWKKIIEIKKGMVIQVGKRKFVKIA